jgi:hypothetical protein
MNSDFQDKGKMLRGDSNGGKNGLGRSGLTWALFLLMILVSSGCQQVQRPELNGEGPLEVTVARGTPTPEYHSPSERWRTLHGELLNRGDFTQRECILCHDPQTGCNQCHQYLGVKKIDLPEASLYWPEPANRRKNWKTDDE